MFSWPSNFEVNGALQKLRELLIQQIGVLLPKKQQQQKQGHYESNNSNKNYKICESAETNRGI